MKLPALGSFLKLQRCLLTFVDKSFHVTRRNYVDIKSQTIFLLPSEVIVIK